MASLKIQRALISVYDKAGIVDFAGALASEFGIEIVSTGGTARLLKESGIAVTLVEEVTGFPEMLDGRVKTLHPMIHAAILADRENPEHMRQLQEQGIKPIDMVVVNLYPFEETIGKPDCAFEQAIEMIDIGGPCMLRAAAKNHKHVLVVYDVHAYAEALNTFRSDGIEVESQKELRLRYASGAFQDTSCYDGEVAKWLGQQEIVRNWPWFEPIFTCNWGDLRYGENPHQQAQLLHLLETPDAEVDLTMADADWGPDVQSSMGLNNYNDAHAALELCKELTRGLCVAATPTQSLGTRSGDRGTSSVSFACTFIKHTNACGVGVADDPTRAYRRAYLGDPSAAMGGILACSFEITKDFADVVMHTYDRLGKKAGAGGFFAEVWLAPAFSEDAIETIREAKPWGKRLRLLDVDDMAEAPDPDVCEYRSISGGLLVQSRDSLGLNEDQWKVVTRRTPTDAEWADLRLAWLVCKHTKSNAITICAGNRLIGNGAGQMSRVMSCRIATWLAKENGHADQLDGAVAASDAFFPFPDGPEILMQAGVKAIIQPGGSKRDDDTIAACDERDVAMIFTGTRHFKH